MPNGRRRAQDELQERLSAAGLTVAGDYVPPEAADPAVAVREPVLKLSLIHI